MIATQNCFIRFNKFELKPNIFLVKIKLSPKMGTQNLGRINYFLFILNCKLPNNHMSFSIFIFFVLLKKTNLFLINRIFVNK